MEIVMQICNSLGRAAEKTQVNATQGFKLKTINQT